MMPIKVLPTSSGGFAASVKVTITGTPSRSATAKDLTLAVLRKMGAAGLLGSAAEFYGDAVHHIDGIGEIDDVFSRIMLALVAF